MMDLFKKIFTFLFRTNGDSSSLVDLTIGDKKECNKSEMLTDITIENNKGSVNISGRDINNEK